VYLLGYRFYAAWIASKVYLVDPTRATPRAAQQRPTLYRRSAGWRSATIRRHRRPGPLVGPTLAAQFGYLPGTLWIIIGSVLGGCVQDMTMLMLSMRRDGRTSVKWPAMTGAVGGFAA